MKKILKKKTKSKKREKKEKKKKEKKREKKSKRENEKREEFRHSFVYSDIYIKRADIALLVSVRDDIGTRCKSGIQIHEHVTCDCGKVRRWTASHQQLFLHA